MTDTNNFNQKIEDELINWLTQNFGFEIFTPGLERTDRLFAPLVRFFREQGTKVVTIAGTNGKGQTAHTLGSYFNLEKKSFALWTSPHILSLRERFVYAEEQIIAEVHYTDLKKAMEAGILLLKQDLVGVRISFYEFLFLVFLLIAREKKKLDYLILEVGLGGRLDAVNHFDADCSCITSISRDHQSILGDRYDLILREKLGVTRKNGPLFTNFSLDYLDRLTEEYVHMHNLDWRRLPKEDDDKNKIVNHYFVENQQMAWQIFKYFLPKSQLSFDEVAKDLPLYKGRREVMTFGKKSLIFIGAHNIDGVRKMLQGYELAEDCLYPESLLVSFSQRPLNEVEVMLKSMSDFFIKSGVEIVLTGFEHPKALDEKSIKTCASKINKGMLNFVSDWKSLLKNSKSQSILVCGSYYFIGEVQRFLRS